MIAQFSCALCTASRLWSISLEAKFSPSKRTSRWQNPYTPPWDISVVVTYVLAKDRSRVQISYVPPIVRKKYTKAERCVLYEILQRRFETSFR